MFTGSRLFIAVLMAFFVAKAQAQSANVTVHESVKLMTVLNSADGMFVTFRDSLGNLHVAQRCQGDGLIQVVCSGIVWAKE